MICRVLGGCRGNRCLIVEAVQVTPGLLEVLDPFLGLVAKTTDQHNSLDLIKFTHSYSGVRQAYLSDHHMAIERSLAKRGRGALHMGPDFSDDRGTKCHIGYEVAIHDIDMKPIGSIVYGL